MKRILATVALFGALTLLHTAAQEPAVTTPEDVLARFSAAFNRGDYQAAAALFAEDAVVTFIPTFFQSPIVSRQELLSVFEALREAEPRMAVTVSRTLADDIVVTRTRLSDGEARAMGIDELVFTEVYVVRDGLIHGAASVMTRESLALALEAMEAMTAE